MSATDPAIQVSYLAGPVDHSDEVSLIVGYTSPEVRDEELARLHALSDCPHTPWRFVKDTGDRDCADLYASALEVHQATKGMSEPDGLVENPNSLLRLFRDPTEAARGWWSVDHGGLWVSAQDLDPNVTMKVTHREVAALHHLLKPYATSDRGDPGAADLRLLLARVAKMDQDDTAYLMARMRTPARPVAS